MPRSQTHCLLHPSYRLPSAVSGAWEHWGYDLTNRRWGYAETLINTTTAAGLTRRWTFTTGGDVSATPTVFNGRLYVPDWNGGSVALICSPALPAAAITSST